MVWAVNPVSSEFVGSSPTSPILNIRKGNFRMAISKFQNEDTLCYPELEFFKIFNGYMPISFIKFIKKP